MTQSPIDTMENRRIRSVAQDYRDQGYVVVVRPGKQDLPTFLADYAVDLYVHNGDDHAIVEVKTRSSLTSAEQLTQLASVLQDRPGWRLDLVMVKARDKRFVEEPIQILNEAEVEERFRQAEELLACKQDIGAMLLAWTATEAAMRLVARHESVGLKEQSPAYLVKQLFSTGVLDRNQYELLDEAVRFRNTIVHGFKMKDLQPQVVRNLVAVGRTLLEVSPL